MVHDVQDAEDFRRSLLQGLQRLNAVGYGQEGSGLELDLVYNPNGAFLAPEQATLEQAYRCVWTNI